MKIWSSKTHSLLFLMQVICFEFWKYLFSYKRQFRFDFEWLKRLKSRYNMNMYICVCMYSFDCYTVGCPWWWCKCSAMESFRVFVCHRRSWQKDRSTLYAQRDVDSAALTERNSYSTSHWKTNKSTFIVYVSPLLPTFSHLWR